MNFNPDKVDWTLYLVTDQSAAGGRSLLNLVRRGVNGGVSVIQLRDKTSDSRSIFEFGRELQKITRPAGIPLIVNDRIDIAMALSAEGVHLGQKDLPIEYARQFLGREKIIGISAERVQEAKDAEAQKADYIGAGDVFGTPSKADAGPPIGLGTLSDIIHAVKIPVVAIGGITQSNTPLVARVGAAGIAVISAILKEENPELASKNLRKLFINAKR